MNEQKIANRVAREMVGALELETERSPLKLDVFVSGITVGIIELKRYTTELAIAESKLNLGLMRVIEWAKNKKIKIKKQEVYLLPGEGEIRCSFYFDRNVEYEYEDLHV